ncbi:MAG: hypothetical protein GKR91_20650 [Pseudomonadales bacterium]|nr:hypothetical protein [Pseudomonadales bacterium]
MGERAQEIGMILFRWFYFLLPLCCVLSIIGMGHRYKRKLFGAMALGTNTITVVILVSLFTLRD